MIKWVVNDISTEEGCRNKCYSTHVETYFTLEKQSDNSIKCYCFKDCDEETWENTPGSTIFEIISDHVAKEIVEDEKEIATLNKELTETKTELSETKTKLGDAEKKADTWEKRYNYVDTNIDGKLQTAVENAKDEVFDKAEADNPLQLESAVGVANCSQNQNGGNSWFQSIFTMTIGAVAGAAMGFHIARDSSKAPEMELLL